MQDEHIAGSSDGQLAVHDTDAQVSSWSTTTAATASPIDSLSMTIELIDTGVAKSSGGGVRQVNIRGGADQ